MVNPSNYLEAHRNRIMQLVRLSTKSKAYYNLTPYPVFAFTDWSIEQNGPYPRCLPFVANIIRRSARWMFGKSISITHKDIDVYNAIIKPFTELYRKDLMRFSSLLDREGAVALRWTPTIISGKLSIKYSVLSVKDNVRYFYSPHDQSKIECAIIQYPYIDYESKAIYMYRELWTADYYVRYAPIRVQMASVYNASHGNMYYDFNQYPFVDTNLADFVGEWKEEEVIPNPLGVIPINIMTNPLSDSQYGEGLLWPVFGVIDNVNLTYHLMNKSNQLHTEPTKIYIDAERATQDEGEPLEPGREEVINTVESPDALNRQAKVSLLEPSGSMRKHLDDYVANLIKQIEDYCGTVSVDTPEITSKGNLTQSVLNLIYGPLVASTNTKRESFEDMLYNMFESIFYSQKKFFKLKEFDTAGAQYSIYWPSYFELSAYDKQMDTDRLVNLESKGLLTFDTVAKKIAFQEGIEEIEEYTQKLINYTPKIYLEAKSNNYIAQASNLVTPKREVTNTTEDDTTSQ